MIMLHTMQCSVQQAHCTTTKCPNAGGSTCAASMAWIGLSQGCECSGKQAGDNPKAVAMRQREERLGVSFIDDSACEAGFVVERQIWGPGAVHDAVKHSRSQYVVVSKCV